MACHCRHSCCAKCNEDQGRRILAALTSDDVEDKKEALGALACAVVQPLMILADLEIGRNGFHRADVVNLTWDELHPTFTGLHDLPTRAKRRYGGMDFVEATDCGCSKYGPLCCPFAARLSPSDAGNGDTVTLLRYISKSLEGYVSQEAYDHRSSCPVCSLVLVNYFLNRFKTR